MRSHPFLESSGSKRFAAPSFLWSGVLMRKPLIPY
jgi:hypothetical protein